MFWVRQKVSSCLFFITIHWKCLLLKTIYKIILLDQSGFKSILLTFHYLFCCPTKHHILHYDRFLDPELWAPYRGSTPWMDFLETKTKIIILQIPIFSLNLPWRRIKVLIFSFFKSYVCMTSFPSLLKQEINSTINFTVYLKIRRLKKRYANNLKGFGWQKGNIVSSSQQFRMHHI